MSIISLAKRTTAITGGSNSTAILGIPPVLGSYQSYISSDKHVVNSLGNIYYINRSCNAVYKTSVKGTLDSTPTVFAGSGSIGLDRGVLPYTDDSFSNLLDLTLDGSGNLYVSDGSQIQIFSTVNPDTQVPSYILSNASNLTSIAVNPSGTKIVGLVGSNALYMYSNTYSGAPFNTYWAVFLSNVTIGPVASGGDPGAGAPPGQEGNVTTTYSFTYPSFTAVACTPDTGVFYGVSPYNSNAGTPTETSVSDDKGGTATVSSYPTFGFLSTIDSSTGAEPTLVTTKNTVDGSDPASTSNTYKSIVFTASNTAYVLVNDQSSIVHPSPVNIISLTGTNAFTTTSNAIYDHLDGPSKLAVFSNAANSAVVVARLIGTSNGLNGFQPMY